jgi:hypothetical protein
MTIKLTDDQNELIQYLDDFIENTKLYFGVYGPAGSGKSFTIGHFIHSNKLYTQTLFSGTTHNACKILRNSIKDTAEKTFNEDLYKLFIDKETLKNNIHCDFLYNKEYINLHNISNIENYIIECSAILSLRHKMQFKTIHSIFMFEQSRDDKHNVIFIPKNSIYKITTVKNKIKYSFLPKFTVKEKDEYNLLNEDCKKQMELNYYRDKYKYFIGCKMIICDESSMLKEFEFEYIKYICKILKVKIIFLGDKYQLPPVDDVQITSDDNNVNEFISNKDIENIKFSSAVMLKYSYTLKTIKRTNNETLQEVYKSYRDIVENYSESKIKIKDVRNIKYFIKNVNTTDKYLINYQINKNDAICYIKNNDNKNNIRALCYTNNEVDNMNHLIRNILYDNPTEKYIKDEELLITKYMCLPKFDSVQLIKINECLSSNNNKYINYILEIITGLDIFKLNYTPDEINDISSIKNIFNKYILNKCNIKLHTSELLKIEEIIEKTVYIKGKHIIINIIFCRYDGMKSFFINFKDEKDKIYVNKILSDIKNNIKLSCNLFKLHNCDENCKMKCNEDCHINCNNLKHHYCNECHSLDFHKDCIHSLQVCNDNCNLVCLQCDRCNSECNDCKNSHKCNYSKKEWEDKYDYISYLINPTIDYSYATTVHKSQGQSIDNVIVCEYNISNYILNNSKIHDNNKILIYLTCMYTAVTRAKNILISLK